MTAKTKHQLLVAIAEHLRDIDPDQATDDDNRDVLRSLRRAAKAALKARGGGNPNLAEARAKGHATNKAKTTEAYRRIEPAIKNLAMEGVVTYADFAAGLNKLGVPSPRGGKWFAASIRRVMQSSH